MALASIYVPRSRPGPQASARAERRRSLARQLLVALCYIAVTRHLGPLCDAFVAPPRRQAQQPLVQAQATKMETTATADVGDKGDAAADGEKLEAKPVVGGEGPFGTKYRRQKSNLPILIALALFAALLICRQDIITILALYEYSSTSEGSWVEAALMVTARLPTDSVTAYGEAALAQPIFVKAVTSGVAYFIGDILAQAFEGRVKLEWLDLSRCARNAAAGFVIHGPALHFWIMFLEGPFSSFIGANAENSAEPWVVISKIFVDQTAFALFLSAVYAVFVGFLAAKPMDEVMQRAKDTIPPSMVSSWRFWPLVHVITYSPFMPVEFKVLWNDVAEIAWVAILSVIANNERDEDPDMQMLVVTEDFGVEPAAEIALASRAEKASRKTVEA